MHELVSARGPFVSVHLPPGTDASELLDPLDVGAATRTTLKRTLASGAGVDGRSVIVAGSHVLVDEPPAWSPPSLALRVSDLPYLLPLAPRHAVRALVGSVPGRAVFDQFVIESARPEGLVVDGLARCAATVSAGDAEALVVRLDLIGDRAVWVGGTHRDEVAADPETTRAAGLPPNPQRADEALPMAALAIGAEVLVTEDLPLADGVGVLLRNPE
ncbi:hypothetical protein [Actinophytocola sp.]|uniref:hypothetical protein n=1 Tax=Actinophytocola sp. TaxID=1872138 RepID=UPI002ED0CE9F